MTTATQGADPTTADGLLAIWRDYRAAVSAQTDAIRAEGPRTELDQYPANIRYIHLPTSSTLSRARYAWMDAVALYRATHPRTGIEGAAFVAKNGNAYEAKCPSHPRFRRVAWTHPRTPACTARAHNVEHHAGAPVVVVDTPTLVPSSMLPC